MTTTRRFKVALSFSHDHVAQVGAIAHALAEKFGRQAVLYDDFHSAEFAQPGLSLHLPRLYREQAELIVVVLSPEYAEKEFCRFEWRQIYSLMGGPDKHRIMLLSVGPPGDLSAIGILPGDGYLDITGRSTAELCGLIENRLRLNAQQAASPVAPPTGDAAPSWAEVPPLPRCFVERPEEFEPLKERLLGGTRGPSGIASRECGANRRAFGLLGMGGLGKSVLACALARDPDVRAAFPDGVYWLTVGRGAPIEQRQARLAGLLGDSSPGIDNWEQGRAKLRRLTASMRCLIVLDDVWETATARAFSHLGSEARLLVTTRHFDVLGPLDAHPHRLGVLLDGPAHALLLSRAGVRVGTITPEELSASEALTAECGGLPLALALVGALIEQSRHNFSTALREVRASRIDGLKFHLDDYAHASVFIALELSLRALADTDPALIPAFHMCSVLEEDSTIPRAALQVLFSRFFEPDHTGEAIDELVQRNLIFASNETYELHDLYHDYLRRVVNDQSCMHRQAVEAYRRLAPNGWHTVPDDGYITGALCRHLRHAGLNEELQRLLLDLRWHRVRLARADDGAQVESLLRDFAHRPHARSIALVEHALRLSGPALNRDHGQLPSQLLGRLADLDVEGLDGLVQQARQPQAAAWFEPLRASLTSPGGALMQTLEVGRPLRSVALGDDALFIGDDQGRVRQYDLATGALTRLIRAETPNTDVSAVAPILDGWRVLVGTSGGDLEAWSPEASEPVWAPPRGAPVSSLAVCEAGRFAWVGRANGMLELWDLQRRERLMAPAAHDGAVNGIVPLGGGTRVVTAGADGRVVLWEGRKEEPLTELGGRESSALCAVAIADDTVAVGYADRAIEVWRTDGHLRYTLTGHGGAVRAMTALPARGWLVSGADDHSIKVWGDGGREVLTRLGSHGNLIHGLVATRSADRVISVSEDRKAKIWDPLSGGLSEEQVAHTNWIRAVALGGAGTWGVTASRDGTAKVWELASGQLLSTVGDGGSSIESVCVVPARDEIALGLACGSIELWRWRPSAALRLPLEGHSKTIAALDVLSNGRLISASYDGTIAEWDLDDGRRVECYRHHQAAVRALCVTPDGRHVLSGDSMGNLHLWAPEGGEADGVIRSFYGHDDFVRTISVDPATRWVLTGSEDNYVRLFDFESGTLLKRFEGHAERVRAVSFLGDGQHIASASSDDTVTVWRIDSREIVVRFFGDSPITGMAVVDPTRIFAAEVEGLVHFLALRAGQMRREGA